MKSKWILMALLPLFAILFGACDDEKTYSDMKNAERREEFYKGTGHKCDFL